mgnify:FL=1|tara:strand:+ start:2091 stop:3764 length:1674 start_codon:yes stop_codon:yes gene_type:complete
MQRDTMGFAGLGFLWLLLSGLILFHFHDQFWWGPDEGVYAYVAQRFLAGDTIHRDLIDIHPGYGNLLNILAFFVFGEDLLSLRYPLVVLTLLQGAAALWLLRPQGNMAAFIGAFAVTAFSFIQFLNPSANWHALAAFFALALCLTKRQAGSASRLLLAGFIVGIAFFTRQLSGVFLAIGLIAVLLSECRDDRSASRVPALILGGVPLLGLAAYVMSKGHLFGLLLIGIWPLALLAILTFRARLNWGGFFRLALLLGAGFLLAGLPVALFMAMVGAFGDWLHDILFSALVINNQDFISARSYSDILVLALANLFRTGIVGAISGTAWTALLLIFPVVGILAVVRLRDGLSLSPKVMLAAVWACSALHYQIPVYLMMAVAPAILALISLSNRPAVLAGVAALSAWAVLFQAARPIDRSLASIVASEAYEPYVASDLPRVSLRIGEDSRAEYAQIIEAIERGSGADEALMTVQMNPEINFMTARRSPVPYYGTQLGLKTAADVEAAIAALDKAAPLFVVHKPNDKYLTPQGAELLKAVQARSPAPQRLGSFELYRYPAPE